MTPSRSPQFIKTVVVHGYEFEFSTETYLVRWVTGEPEKDGTPIHTVTVYRQEYIGGEQYRLFKISDLPVIMKGWLPTVKRSKKILSAYLY